MIEVGNGMDVDQVVVMGIKDQIIEIDLSMDKILDRGLNMLRIT